MVPTIGVHYSGLCLGGPDWKAEVYEGRVEAVSNGDIDCKGDATLG